MRFHVELAQTLEQTDTVDGARGAGDTDYQLHLCQFPTPNAQRPTTPNGQRPTTPNVNWKLGIGSGWDLVIGSWELTKGYHRGSCSSERPKGRCSARRAASSSASTTRPATTAAAVIPACGDSRRPCARSAATSASCHS